MFDFPEAIRGLKEADVPFEGCKAYMVQGEGEQVLFMSFERDVELPVHAHEAQWGIVLSGRIDLTIGDRSATYIEGDNYYIPGGVSHGGKIHSGYSDMTYFDQKDRYLFKKGI